jgi:hypothetical protein
MTGGVEVGWSGTDLAAIGGAIQVDLAAERADGTLRRPVAVWVVRVDDDLYVRAIHGPERSWYRGTRTRLAGMLWAAGLERAVRFADPAGDLDDRVDAAYREKYGSWGPSLDLVLMPGARAATIRLLPA